MLDWLIIGGGVHGTHLSLSLLRRNRISPDRIRVLDPHPEPLHAWWRRCTVTGMTHLRSPVDHHIGLKPKGLHRYAGRGKLPRGALQSPFELPSVKLFSRHCEHLIHEHHLQKLRLQGSAHTLDVKEEKVCVETDKGQIEARRIVLALGPSGLHWPTWAQEARKVGAPVEHAFGTDYCRASFAPQGELLVVGGGQSAVQLALELATTHPGRVTLLSRHDWRVAHFDAEPTWIGAGLKRFQSLRCPRERRNILGRARINGSVTSRERRRFRRAEDRGHVRRRVGEVDKWRCKDDGILLTLSGTSEELAFSQVLLATGFSAQPPGGSWLSDVAEAIDLPRAPCGYPLVDELLQWHPRLHVSGALAELELGPSARNIIGARMAAERLARLA